jgi:hypothetical protein
MSVSGPGGGYCARAIGELIALGRAREFAITSVPDPQGWTVRCMCIIGHDADCRTN